MNPSPRGGNQWLSPRGSFFMLAFEIIGAVLVLMSLGAMVSTDTRAILR